MASRKKAAKRSKTASRRTARPARKAAKRATVRAPKRAKMAKRASRTPRKRTPAAPAARKITAGLITHTELASSNPEATREWCERVLGWKFGEPMPSPGGPYHMWRFDTGTGGGIRATHPPETPGSIPYCEVPDIRAAFDKAIAAGGTTMMAPEEIPGGMGWIAIVAAPGGVPIGFWGPK